MKKTILVLLLMAAGGSAMCQMPRYYDATSARYYGFAIDDDRTTVSGFTAVLNAPRYPEHAFRKQFPNAVQSQWYRVADDWWWVAYTEKGPWQMRAYNSRGESYPIGLPILQNAVPKEVVSSVLERFNCVYDISELRNNDLTIQYVVRTLEKNGELKTIRVGSNGKDLLAKQ
ncbi:MAG: hypothetical protein JO301_17415 [Chitinophagaceae bacterium]|nr:hypothetical protein [Chitinophagaceae bacterium]